MHAHVGTSGFQYDEWKGEFYPADLKKGEMLSYYASRLGAVEINNTFYRMPRASTLESWAQQVPDRFKFVLKVSRKITHFKRLQDVEEELEYLTRTAAALGERLGPLLFQLPPKFPKQVERLAETLRQLPDSIEAAFEFRDPSWLAEDVHQLLRQHNAALCEADTDARPPDRFESTADWGYLRLRAEEYSPQQLTDWVEWLHQRPWQQAYIFFKHEARGASYASQLAERL